MQRERRALPHAVRRLFLMDAGLETEAGLRGGVGAAEFAPHTLLAHSAGRFALARYFRGYLSIARRFEAGFVLDSPTAKAHARCAGGATETELRKMNRDAVDFVADLRDEFYGTNAPIVLNGVIGRCSESDGGPPALSAAEAQDYYGQQIGWLADTDVDMVTASAVTDSAEATGIVTAARRAGIPVVLSFGIGKDGLLPGGRRLCELIAEIDAATRHAPAYYGIACEHPDQLRALAGDVEPLRRVKGVRFTAALVGQSRREPAERPALLGPQLLLELYRRVTTAMPWINVVGGRY